MVRSAIATAAAIAAGETSARAEAEAAIARIEALDGPLNAVVVRDFDRALAAAARADEAVERGVRLPLLGVPMTVKEAFDVDGLPTTRGMPRFRQAIALKDAAAVARLKAAGAIVLGKTNVAFALADHQSTNPVYGRTGNPADPERTPGGSSGGSAAAVASGMVPIELGSDIAGSIRVPAAFTGIWGHKPTFGLLDNHGHDFPGTDGAAQPMNVIGPLARDPDDLQLVLELLADHPLRPAEPRAPGEWRILLMRRHPAAPVQKAIVDVLDAVGDAFEAAGAKVDRDGAALPFLEEQHWQFMQLLQMTAAANLPDLVPISPSLAEWREQLDNSARATRAWTVLFDRYDAIITPAFGVVAYPHDDMPVTERRLTVDDMTCSGDLQLAYPGMVNFTGLPATAVPIGTDAEGLPIGIQVIAGWHRDLGAIAAARAAHELTRHLR